MRARLKSSLSRCQAGEIISAVPQRQCQCAHLLLIWHRCQTKRESSYCSSTWSCVGKLKESWLGALRGLWSYWILDWSKKAPKKQTSPWVSPLQASVPGRAYRRVCWRTHHLLMVRDGQSWLSPAQQFVTWLAAISFWAWVQQQILWTRGISTAMLQLLQELGQVPSVKKYKNKTSTRFQPSWFMFSSGRRF